MKCHGTVVTGIHDGDVVMVTKQRRTHERSCDQFTVVHFTVHNDEAAYAAPNKPVSHSTNEKCDIRSGTSYNIQMYLYSKMGKFSTHKCKYEFDVIDNNVPRRVHCFQQHTLRGTLFSATHPAGHIVFHYNI